jgi:hypothetical protein
MLCFGHEEPTKAKTYVARVTRRDLLTDLLSGCLSEIVSRGRKGPLFVTEDAHGVVTRSTLCRNVAGQNRDTR